MTGFLRYSLRRDECLPLPLPTGRAHRSPRRPTRAPERGAFAHWARNPGTEPRCGPPALDEARQQFLELADDPAYWARTASTLDTVGAAATSCWPRTSTRTEGRAFGIWHAGDLLSRAAYAAAGLAAALVVWRTAIPDWFEPVPLALILLGPLIPDFQAGMAKRRYRKGLDGLIHEMAQEQVQQSTYQPLGLDEPSSSENSTNTVERDRRRGHEPRARTDQAVGQSTPQIFSGQWWPRSPFCSSAGTCVPCTFTRARWGSSRLCSALGRASSPSCTVRESTG